MGLTVRTGNKSVEDNPFPAPASSGYYLLQITRTGDKPLAKDPRVTRVYFNLKCLTDHFGEKALGFANWSAMSIPAELEDELSNYNPALNQRKFRNAMRIIAEVDDETLDSGEVDVDFADWKELKVWAWVECKERVFNGETRTEGEVQRFVTHDDVLKATGQITEEAAPLDGGEAGGDEVADEEAVADEPEDEVPAEEGEEDEIPEVAPPTTRQAAKPAPTPAATATGRTQTATPNQGAKPGTAKPGVTAKK